MSRSRLQPVRRVALRRLDIPDFAGRDEPARLVASAHEQHAAVGQQCRGVTRSRRRAWHVDQLERLSAKLESFRGRRSATVGADAACNQDRARRHDRRRMPRARVPQPRVQDGSRPCRTIDHDQSAIWAGRPFTAHEQNAAIGQPRRGAPVVGRRGRCSSTCGLLACTERGAASQHGPGRETS